MGSYYEVLGLENIADSEAVESAYRKLSEILNPEIHENNAVVMQKFREISEAYAILSVPEQKELYDKRLREMNLGGNSTTENKAAELNHIQKEMQLKFIESYNRIRFDKKIRKERKRIELISIIGLIALITSLLIWIILKVYQNLPD
jgi:curved DNA-binding protein CbpA